MYNKNLNGDLFDMFKNATPQIIGALKDVANNVIGKEKALSKTQAERDAALKNAERTKMIMNGVLVGGAVLLGVVLLRKR